MQKEIIMAIKNITKGQFPLYWLDHTISKYREPITSSCIRKGLVRQYLHSTYSPRPSAGVKWWPWCLKSNSCSHDPKSPVSCQEETLIEVSLFQQSREHSLPSEPSETFSQLQPPIFEYPINNTLFMSQNRSFCHYTIIFSSPSPPVIAYIPM